MFEAEEQSRGGKGSGICIWGLAPKACALPTQPESALQYPQRDLKPRE